MIKPTDKAGALFFALCCASASFTNVGAAESTESAATGGLAQITISLLVVVGLLVGLSVLFKKFGLNRIANGLPFKVIGAVSIGNNQRLMVIEVGDEWIVLGVTPQQITTITKMPRQENVPGSNSGGDGKVNFSTWMQSALEKYHAKKP
jgi:flagellar protein FliO/FliZ